MPDISVVIPTYNRRHYVQQAIASCFTGNEDLDIEIVVVDDGSKDGTRDYLTNFQDERVRPFFQDHQGGQVARNRGLQEARGQYVKFLDDDDWLAERALLSEVCTLEDLAADIVYGNYQFVSAEGPQVQKKVQAVQYRDFMAGLLDGRILTHPLRFTYRRSFVEGLQWDPSIPARQDLAFAFAVGTRLPVAIALDKVVGYFRQHRGERVSAEANAYDNPPRRHAEILIETVEQLRAEGKLNSRRREAAARGLWTWGYLMALRDWPMFVRMYDLIEEVHPQFLPDRTNSFFATLDKLVGPKNTERLGHPVRRAKKTLFG